MTRRTYTVHDVVELATAIESRRQAEAGDTALLLVRLAAGRASAHELDQAFLAKAFGGEKKKRGPKIDPSLEAKQRQAAFFFHILTRRGALPPKSADGRLAVFFGTGDDNIRKWRGADARRMGNGPARVEADLDGFDFWRAALFAEPRIAQLLEIAK